jgi:hypothetical protein
MPKALVAPLAEAVSVADWVVETAATAAVKLAEVAPAATVTEAGTLTDELLLARFTARPPVGAAADRVTAQASEPAAEKELVEHETSLRVAAAEAFSCSPTEANPPFADAFTVAVVDELTAETVAVKATEVAPAVAVTVEGTVTAALELVSETARPPVGAAAVSITEQESVPAPENVCVGQLIQLTAAAGFSCRL